MFDVIKSGNLASLIVPSVILAPLSKLVAVVAVPVKPPSKVVAVTIPVTLASPTTWRLDIGVSVPIPSLLVDGLNTKLCVETPAMSVVAAET